MKVRLPVSIPGLLLLLSALLVLTTGCVGPRVIWSPDGSRAALFGEDGFYLIDSGGHPSGPFLTNVDLGCKITYAAWFPDSRRLLIPTKTDLQTWSDYLKFKDKLISNNQPALEEAGKAIVKALDTNRELGAAVGKLSGLSDWDKQAAVLYARQILGTDWTYGKWEKPELTQLCLATLKDERLELGPAIYTGRYELSDLRVSPSGAAVCFTAGQGKGETGALWVVATDGASPAQMVSDDSSVMADWTPDGKSLVYATPTGRLNTQQDSLGKLTRRAVFNAAGKLEVQTEAEDLAEMLFDEAIRVRCLPDGRILFPAVDTRLPFASQAAAQQPQLFAFDPAWQQAVVPVIPPGGFGVLPEKLMWYEPSPDGKLVAVAADKGGVFLVTLANGKVETLQPQGDDDLVSAPTWRATNELCYVFATNGAPKQVVLWSNGVSRIISSNWPPQLRKSFLDN